MILAYTTPQGWSMAAMIAYAAITNTLLDDALLDEQHALRGAGRRDDRRCARARQAQLLPLRRGERRAIHRRRIHAALWSPNSPPGGRTTGLAYNTAGR